MWNASRFCVSSLRRGHANLLCIVPILVYVLPKQVHHVSAKMTLHIGINPVPIEMQYSGHRQSVNNNNNVQICQHHCQHEREHELWKHDDDVGQAQTTTIKFLVNSFYKLFRQLKCSWLSWRPLIGEMLKQLVVGEEEQLHGILLTELAHVLLEPTWPAPWWAR